MSTRTIAAMLAALAFGLAGLATADRGFPPPGDGPPTEAQDERININQAVADELVQLPGIGPSRAQAIIAEREKRKFRRIEDIMRVPGIGRKTFGRIRASIRVQ